MAALTVVFGHFGFMAGTPSLGVVLFFVLSGFLIGKLYLHRPCNGAEVWSYALARFARVYPLFAAVVIGAGLVNLTVPQAELFHLPPIEVPQHLLLAGSRSTIWTICVEFQFYALFVAVWALASRGYDEKRLLVALILGFWLYAVLKGGFAGRTDVLSYLHVFAIGLLLARLTDRPGLQRPQAASAALPLLLGLYFALYLFAHVFHEERVIYANPVALVVCAGLVWASQVPTSGPAHRVLSSPVAFWLGEVSFGTYLLHRPAMALAENLVGPHLRPVTVMLAIGLTLAFAQCAFVFVERPARKRIREWGRTPMLARA